MISSQHLITLIRRFRQVGLYQTVQKSLILLFPFVLVGSISQVIQLTLLNRNSFFATIFNWSTWLGKHQFLMIIFNHLTSLTLGIVAALAAFSMARYTAKYYQRDEQLAGLTGLIAYLILAIRYTANDEITFTQGMLGMGGLFLGLLVGYLVGLAFKKLARPQRQTTQLSDATLARAVDSIWAILVVLIMAVLLSLLLNWLAISVLPDQVILKLQSLKANQTSFGFTLEITMLTGLMTFFGLTSMPTLAQFGRDGVATNANLNYALAHHTAWGVPYPYTLGTLYEPFGAIGGTGGTLALLIAIFLFSHQTNQQIISRWSLLPVMFSFNSTALIGLPILGNGLYLIPFLLVPLVNMAVGALAIACHVMPAVVYNVPLGTPSLLQAFVGTNGHWGAMVVVIINVVLGVLIYRPFVKLANRLNEQGGPADV